MTPFGERVRELRRARGISQKKMAQDIGVSAAYLSALEHGHRSPPTWPMVQKIIGYFNIIWDDADELQQLASLSHPRVTVDTSGMPQKATALANLLAHNIGRLSDDELDALYTNLNQLLHAKAKARLKSDAN